MSKVASAAIRLGHDAAVQPAATATDRAAADGGANAWVTAAQQAGSWPAFFDQALGQL